MNLQLLFTVVYSLCIGVEYLAHIVHNHDHPGYCTPVQGDQNIVPYIYDANVVWCFLFDCVVLTKPLHKHAGISKRRGMWVLDHTHEQNVNCGVHTV